MNFEDQEFKEEKVNFNTWQKILKTVLKSKKECCMADYICCIVSNTRIIHTTIK